MAKIFFKNLGISLLTTIVVMLIAGFICMFVILISQELLRIEMSVLAIMITDGILSLVVSVVWLGVAAGLNWDWFYSGEDDCCKKPPHLIVGFLLLLLIPLIFGGTSALMAYTGYEKLVSAVKISDNYNFLLLLFPAVTVSQLSHFIVKIYHYGAWQMCWHCGRMFCFDYHYTGSKSWDETSYKTYKTKENVGSIYAGDRKIMDVKGNVSHGYRETWHYNQSSYTGVCRRCNNEKYNSKFYGHKD